MNDEMTKLNQIVAIEKGEKAAINKQTAPLFQKAGVPALFHGLTKTYEPVDENGEQYPDENTLVQLTVTEILDAFRVPTTRLLDVISTKENANTGAFADVVVDGRTIIKDAPVTFLLQFEKQLAQEIRGLVNALPTLDPAQEWSPSSTDRAGISETPVIKRHKTKKIQRPIQLAKATDKHPEQVQLISEDVLAGYWSEKKFSGAISAARKQELLDRVDKLINAVKYAREQANDREITDKKVGKHVFDFLLA